MTDLTPLLAWGTQTLGTLGVSSHASAEIVVETPWSTVIRFATPQGAFYLKQTPKDLFLEPLLIKLIQGQAPTVLTPIVLAKHEALHCFIMKSCGDYSLRTKFNGVLEPNLLFKGIKSYIEIERAFEDKLDVLLDLRVPDWRIEKLPELYKDLVDNKELLLAEGLNAEEIAQLAALTPTIQQRCEGIDDTIEPTLVNGDFNENNLIITESTQSIAIIDWGECVITHPFFSIASHLQSLARRYQLDSKGPLLEGIRQQYVACWSDRASPDELEAIYQSVLTVHPIFSVLALHRLQTATDNKSKQQQNWFIAGLIRSLLG